MRFFKYTILIVFFLQCSQGFSVSENQSKLTYDFQNIRQNGKNLSSKKGYEETGGEILTPSSSDLYGKKLICEEERKTRFKCKNISTQIANEKDKQQIKDPAELTLAERKALFERNSETSTQPKNGRNVSKLADCHGKTGKSTFMEANNCQKTLCITEKQNLVCDTPMLNSDVLENQSDCKITKPENCSLKAEYVEEKNISKSPAPVPDIVNPEVSAVSNGAASVLDNAEKDDSSHVRLYPNLSDLDLTDTSELTNSEIEISNERYFFLTIF